MDKMHTWAQMHADRYIHIHRYTSTCRKAVTYTEGGIATDKILGHKWTQIPAHGLILTAADQLTQ
jgi:hypothetical protein